MGLKWIRPVHSPHLGVVVRFSFSVFVSGGGGGCNGGGGSGSFFLGGFGGFGGGFSGVGGDFLLPGEVPEVQDIFLVKLRDVVAAL
jgi:hypothetical protein